LKPQLQQSELPTNPGGPASPCCRAGVEEHDCVRVQYEDRRAGVPPGLPVRIVVSSSQQLLRDGIRELLKIAGEIMVLAETATALSAVEMSLECCPDILLIDCSLKNPHEMEQIREAAARLPKTRLLLLTDAATRSELRQLMSGIVCRVLLKETATSQELLATIRAVMAPEQGSEEPAEYLETEERDSLLPFGLTIREMEILNVLAGGLTSKQIAQKLSISEHTVKHHLSHIFDKTGVDTRLELVLFAHHHQLFEGPGDSRVGERQDGGAAVACVRGLGDGEGFGDDLSCRSGGVSGLRSHNAPFQTTNQAVMRMRPSERISRLAVADSVPQKQFSLPIRSSCSIPRVTQATAVLP